MISKCTFELAMMVHTAIPKLSEIERRKDQETSLRYIEHLSLARSVGNLISETTYLPMHVHACTHTHSLEEHTLPLNQEATTSDAILWQYSNTCSMWLVLDLYKSQWWPFPQHPLWQLESACDHSTCLSAWFVNHVMASTEFSVAHYVT